MAAGRLNKILAFGGIALLSAPARADDIDPRDRALAAGFTALQTCGAVFSAGRTMDQVRDNELKGFDPDLQPIVDKLDPVIDKAAKSVSVAFDPKLPPRYAFWRQGLGCVQLPVGATPSDSLFVPGLAGSLAPPNLDSRRWPTGDGDATATPTGDRKALEHAIDLAFDRRTYGQGTETTAIIVVQNGKIVAERYRPDFDMHTSQRTWSAAKSINVTVIGAAVQEGKFDVFAPASIPEWRTPGDPRAKITTDQLLRMSSGLDDETLDVTYSIYFGGDSLTDVGPGRPVIYAPATHFAYSNNDAMLAARSLRRALGDGEGALEFPLTHLLWRVGMTRTYPGTDWRGNFLASSQIWTTARDLARFGLLYLNNGVWNGQRILPADWAAYVAKEGPAQPPEGNPMAEGGRGYGAGFWTAKASSGLPAGTYSALGSAGQIVTIIPARNVVIVRRAYDPWAVGFDLNHFVSDVLKALK